MSLVLSESERVTLVGAAARERRVRQWRRYQVVLLVADGTRPEQAAASVGCSRASVYSWLAAWRAGGLAGLAEAPHPPPIQAHAAPLETLLTTLLADDPQRHGHHATGWTIPLLHGGRGRRGSSSASTRCAGRCAGWGGGGSGRSMCWVAPTRRTRKKGAIVAAVARTLGVGGSVWFADETTVREFPPLRAGWARRGEQAVVTITGRNARRVVHGALNIVTGELVRVVRERSRGRTARR